MTLNKKSITKYQEVNDTLEELTKKYVDNFGQKLIAVYLAISVSFEKFDPESSDIDIMVVLQDQLSIEEFEMMQKWHSSPEPNQPLWVERMQCSYVPLDNILHDVFTPREPRIHLDNGEIYSEEVFRSEWLINQYLLYKYSITLFGQDFKTLLSEPIDISYVQKACIQLLVDDWYPKTKDLNYLQQSHHQSYAVLTMCRILYIIILGEASSKKDAISWAKKEFGSQWNYLIQIAENWHYGAEMHLQEDTANFIKFVMNKANIANLRMQKH